MKFPYIPKRAVIFLRLSANVKLATKFRLLTQVSHAALPIPISSSSFLIFKARRLASGPALFSSTPPELPIPAPAPDANTTGTTSVQFLSYSVYLFHSPYLYLSLNLLPPEGRPGAAWERPEF